MTPPIQDQAARPPKLRYRPDIDGLRAVAVLLVVFDHLETRVRGGYVGVDVFFVISGYLISAHILSEMGRGRFSVADFYERRVRRIFPALLVMLAVTIGLAWRYLLPSETESFGQSVVAAVLSVSNFLFWSQAGYFDGASSLKPLLHTWSLAVEEQFYLFFPLLIVAVRRWWPARLKAAIWGAMALSFGLACWWVHHAASVAFFWSPLRGWELLIGTVVSQNYLPKIRSTRARNVASLLGMALILVPAFVFNARTPFPGLAAVPACVGTALIITAGETGGSLVASVLAWRPVVFVGLISYSLYLWHWPLIVFWNRGQMLADNYILQPRDKVILLATSLAAATLSWALVETPFRKGRFKPGRTMLFAVNGVAIAVVVAAGGVMMATHGVPQRFSPQAAEIMGYLSYHPAKEWRENQCFLVPPGGFDHFDASHCLAEVPGKPQVLLVGDSLAAQMYPGLVKVFPEQNVSQATSASCTPLLVVPAETQPQYADNCLKMTEFLFGSYLPSHHPSAVMLAASWVPLQMPELGRTIAALKQQGQRVIVMGPVPEYDTPLPRVLALAMRTHEPETLLRAHRVPWVRQVDDTMRELARSTWGVEYISAFDDLCSSQVEMVAKAQIESGDGCPVLAAPGVPLQFDVHHLTVEGSVLYAQEMRAKKQLP